MKRLWYILPILLGVVGGLMGTLGGLLLGIVGSLLVYFFLKRKDKILAKNILVTGIVTTILFLL